ncbi:unnamed protein product [Periconia digitata]|uniref:Alb1-domain-containing protein n=1 Tax=Periconia digitata TaxID=1303443 RepID=A0A9W4UT86_9PLEO|nr:unnamed protein product [Periconia digitata]
MAKTAKLKKKQSTQHSRAARRAVSPTDPSIIKATTAITTRTTSASPPPDAGSQKPHVLAAQNAGIQKRSKGKQMTRAQRQRQLKGMERAEQNMDKLELKVAKSVGRERKVKERAKGWEEVNALPGKGKKGKKTNGEVDEDGDEAVSKSERRWELDEEMEDGGALEETPVAVGGEVKEMNAVVPETAPVLAAKFDDELL